MKATIAAATALLSYASSVVAQTVVSQPFLLTLNSTNNDASQDGTLTTCGFGKFNSLCVGSTAEPSLANTFRFKYDNSTPDFGNGKAGTLLWSQQDSVDDAQELSLLFNAINNIAIPVFGQQAPSEGFTTIGYNPDGEQNIQGYVAADYYYEGFYNWYICQGDFSDVHAGTNETLVWTVGGGEPKGDCYSIDVIREFI